MEKIKFAIVGCGNIAKRHASHIIKLGELTAVCDVKPERAENLGKEFKSNYYSNIDDMLKYEQSVNIVSICSPNGLHAEHTIQCLKAGKHVLCEKPMAITVKDCERMITEAEKANKRLFIVKQNRFNPPIVALKNVIDEGKLGKIYSVQLNCFWNRNADYYKQSDWKGTKSLDGGTLYTQFSHFIDLLYWLFGDIEKVSAKTFNYAHQGLIEFEDTGVVVFEFDNGVLGTMNYTINSYGKNMEGSITVFGENGTVKVGGQYLNVLEYQNIKDLEIKDLPQSGPANDYGFYQGSMSNHDLVYLNIVDVFTNSGSIMTNALEGLKTVQIIEKIYKSAKSLIRETVDV